MIVATDIAAITAQMTLLVRSSGPDSGTETSLAMGERRSTSRNGLTNARQGIMSSQYFCGMLRSEK
jgi:hypothetical protein